jgi:hypothetical protein
LFGSKGYRAAWDTTQGGSNRAPCQDFAPPEFAEYISNDDLLSLQPRHGSGVNFDFHGPTWLGLVQVRGFAPSALATRKLAAMQSASTPANALQTFGAHARQGNR